MEKRYTYWERQRDDDGEWDFFPTDFSIVLRNHESPLYVWGDIKHEIGGNEISPIDGGDFEIFCCNKNQVLGQLRLEDC